MDGYGMLILPAYVMVMFLFLTLADFHLSVIVKVNPCAYGSLIIVVPASVCNAFVFLTDKLVIPVFATVFGDFTDNREVWQSITFTLCRVEELYGVSFNRLIW